jgi:hypothetical protein
LLPWPQEHQSFRLVGNEAPSSVRAEWGLMLSRARKTIEKLLMHFQQVIEWHDEEQIHEW